MFTHPGAKLLFMGDEFGQTHEWNFTASLDWHLLEHHVHKGLQTYVKDLNKLYTTEKSFYENQFKPDGFEWVEANDIDNSIFIYLRKGMDENEVTMTVLNLTPRVFDYKIGVNEGTNWEVILNSDDEKYGGSGVKAEIVDEEDDEWMYRPNAIILKLPPLAGVVLKQKQLLKPKKKAVSAKISKPKTASKSKKIENSEVERKATSASKKVTPRKIPVEKKVEEIQPKVSRLKKAIVNATLESEKILKKK